MSKITHQEIYQFFSRLTSNTSPITSTTNFKTLVGLHSQFSSFLAVRTWVIPGEVTVKPGSGETQEEERSH